MTNQEFFYTALGQENRRTSKTTVDTTTLDNQVTRSTYDPGGYTDTVKADQLVDGGPKVDPDIDYLYEASGQLIAKTKTTATGTNTKLFFYWQSGTSSRRRRMARARPRSATCAAQAASLWRSRSSRRTHWAAPTRPGRGLLTDPEGNVATHLRRTPTVPPR